eukprot:2300110-Pleurochrysis_carterae.AAC.2
MSLRVACDAAAAAAAFAWTVPVPPGSSAAQRHSISSCEESRQGAEHSPLHVASKLTGMRCASLIPITRAAVGRRVTQRGENCVHMRSL